MNCVWSYHNQWTTWVITILFFPSALPSLHSSTFSYLLLYCCNIKSYSELRTKYNLIVKNIIIIVSEDIISSKTWQGKVIFTSCLLRVYLEQRAAHILLTQARSSNSAWMITSQICNRWRNGIRLYGSTCKSLLFSCERNPTRFCWPRIMLLSMYYQYVSIWHTCILHGIAAYHSKYIYDLTF